VSFYSSRLASARDPFDERFGTHVTSEELLLAEDLVVNLEVLGERLGELGDALIVGLSTTHAM
jgi:hypothetical protein